MALPPTELRYRKSMRYFILIVSGFILITLPLTFMSGGSAKATPFAYLVGSASVILLVFVSQWLYRRASSKEPVLIFRSDGLQVVTKNNRLIQWGEITEWKIRRYKSSHSLIVYTRERTTRIDITWLDLPVKEIEELVRTYIRQPGPGGFLR